MKKSTIDFTLKVRLPILLFVAILAFTVTYFVTRAERDGVGYTPLQPINFSHKLHAGTMQIDCKYCHTGVETSPHATIPPVSTCMNCHTVARKNKPDIINLTRYYETGTPLRWNRVHKVPDYAYFNHSAHVTRGIDCANCHGNVKNMDVVAKVSEFTMGACIDCHRNAPSRIHDVQNIKKGPEYCSACHR